MIHSRVFKSHVYRDPYVCFLAAAVLGAGALSAGAGIWGANKAAGAQTDAANASIANQQQMYAKNSNNLSPFINAGAGGIGNLQDWLNPAGSGGGVGAGGSDNALSSLLKLVTPGANQNATLQQTPGYQFSVDQGTRGALNALAARGLGGSPGAIAKGVGGFVAGTASQNYNNIVSQLLNTFTAGAGADQNLVNSGITAGSSLAGVGTNTANAISGSLTGAGNAQAAAANATGSAVGGLGNSATTAALLQQLTGGGGGGVYGTPGTPIAGATGATSYGGPNGPQPLFGIG